MWVIIEGPDGAGKTSLARDLETRGWIYRHAGAEDRLHILAARMDRDKAINAVVWDRAHLGELVYGQLDRKSDPHPGWWNLIEAFLLDRNAVPILMEEPIDVLAARRPEETEARLRDLTLRFRRATNQSALRWFRPTWDINLVSTYNPYTVVTGDEGGVGARQPEVWVLGERLNPEAGLSWPFATDSGIHYVWPAIDVRSVRVSYALDTPSVDDDVLHRARSGHFDAISIERLNHRWMWLGRPGVIALGAVAQGLAKEAGIPHLNLDYPRRQEQWKYTADLRSAIVVEKVAR